jgi:RHS repeat-associated protein
VGQAGTLYYLFTDHLGSTSVTYDTTTSQAQTMRYYPWGETRSGAAPTDRLFTGQRFDGTIELYDYGARFYDPALGRFVQPDTVVPDPSNPQALNRYSYVYNNPLRYTDPTGHQPGKWLRSVIRWAQPHVYRWTGPGSPLYSHRFRVGWASVSIRDINNRLGDLAMWGLRSSEIQRAARDAGVPTILLAAALHHQGGSPDLRDWIVLNLGLESEEMLSRGIGQITIKEAKYYNKEDLVLDPVPDETLDEALYIREVSVRYMAAKLKESSQLIDEYLRKPPYSTISLSDENRWLLLMPAQNIGTGAVNRFFKVCGGDWSCWFADWSIYSQVLSMRDDIAWLKERGWTDDR